MASNIINYSNGKSEIVVANHHSGIVNFLRSGACVNLNDIAEPFGKRVDNWTRLKGVKDLFDFFEKDPAYSGLKPVIRRDLRSEGTGKFVAGGGLMAHPHIAIQFAQWCSPGFALWVSRQIEHLLVYGEVNLHYTEWTPEELEAGYEYNREDADELYGGW